MMERLRYLLLASYSLPIACSFLQSAPVRHQNTDHFKLFAGNILDQLFKEEPTFTYPKVTPPPDFVAPEPQPLTLTSSTDKGEFATASAALALRLATGAFVLGWKIDTINAPLLNEEGKEQYSLKLGPIRLRDSSSVLDEALRPEKMLVLNDNESSPSCKRVREMMNLLDLTFECRPCFGFGENGECSVPSLYDPNVDQTILGDVDIIEALLQRYGPPESTFE
jgi:hypothetical protein